MNAVQKELETIGKRNHGLLRPCDVVDFARDKDTSLHSRFEWDDRKASDEYRLWQARQILRIEVITLENDSEPIRAFVSLRDDRSSEGGGYRSIVQVLSNAALREKMIAEALDDADLFRKKWERLSELADIFAAIKFTRNRQTKKRKTKRKRLRSLVEV